MLHNLCEWFTVHQLLPLLRDMSLFIYSRLTITFCNIDTSDVLVECPQTCFVKMFSNSPSPCIKRYSHFQTISASHSNGNN